MVSRPTTPAAPPVQGGAPAAKGARSPGKHAPGSVTVGVFREADTTFLLCNANTEGEAEITFAFGAKGDLPVAGDWNGDGTTGVGVYRPRGSSTCATR